MYCMQDILRTFPSWVVRTSLLWSLHLQELWMLIVQPFLHWPPYLYWQERNGGLVQKYFRWECPTLEPCIIIGRIKGGGPILSCFWKDISLSSSLPSDTHSLATIIFLEISGLISQSLIHVYVSVITKNLELWGDSSSPDSSSSLGSYFM